jgi:hypothetical protein
VTKFGRRHAMWAGKIRTPAIMFVPIREFKQQAYLVVEKQR